MSEPNNPTPRTHVLTVQLEDYYHMGTLNELIIQRGQWYRFESRLENNTRRVLDLLDEFNIKATFFVVGWIADRYPEIVREVAARGHEIASQGYFNRSIGEMTREGFREDLARSREALERAGNTKVIGYRVGYLHFLPRDLWALEVLAKEGYVYDSSVCPLFRLFTYEPWRRFVHKLEFGDKVLWEFPFTSLNFLGWHLPIAGGNYFRQFPHTLMKHAVDYWQRNHESPFVMYFHVWELDQDLPRVNTASWLSKVRHYRNLGKMTWILEDYFRKYRFTGIAHYLGLSTRLIGEGAGTEERPVGKEPVLEVRSPDAVSSPSSTSEPIPAKKASERIPATIVVPCFNEVLVLPYLCNTLKSVKAQLEGQYDLHFVFVDDFSGDTTFSSLQKLFGTWPNCEIVRHDRNQGVAAAILTGIRHAPTEIVCSIDCDCTYDPHELSSMLPMLKEGVDMVTASPYHPQGHVRNVPPWRLKLSKASSFLYRRVLRQKLYTYTSCFRVYRKNAVLTLKLREPRFPGIAEILAQLDLQGYKIVEYPTTLEVRLLGRSKMKILIMILNHLKIMTRFALTRMFGKKHVSKVLSKGNILP